ncbi:MAG TPA: hypothetical protein ENK55_09695, partial [Actinobacteria bacterium]|nr:hypothetical protein [Actinomycetota bacterium]
TSARLGALTGGAAPEVVEAVSDWAWEMGLVFQIADDVLDLVASEEWLGKPAGSDIREGVYTLPVLLAAEGPLRGRLEELLVPEPPREPAIVEEVISLVVDGGYVDRALDHAVERVRRAEKAADVIDDPAVRTVLSNLDRYLLDRVEDARRRSGR